MTRKLKVLFPALLLAIACGDDGGDPPVSMDDDMFPIEAPGLYDDAPDN